MDLPFASQRPAVKFWAVLTSIVIGVLVILSGVSLMLAERMDSIDYDARNYLVTSHFGLGVVSAVWLVHAGLLVSLLGYGESRRRQLLAVVLFAICAGFLVFVLIGVGLPFQYNGMSVM